LKLVDLRVVCARRRKQVEVPVKSRVCRKLLVDCRASRHSSRRLPVDAGHPVRLCAPATVGVDFRIGLGSSVPVPTLHGEKLYCAFGLRSEGVGSASSAQFPRAKVF
jgi:hypothetical protein